MSFVVGLTGGIGSGKSAVADLFSALGVPVIDTDAIAHELTTVRGAAMPALRHAFGDAVMTPEGALDRAAMRSLVFADPAARQRLEAVLHPLIRQESDRRIRAESADGAAAYVVLMVPLLIESGAYRERVKRIAVVDCEEETQIKRVMARSELSRAEVLRILQAQATRAQRLAAADDVIANDGELALLGPQVAQLHKEYVKSIVHVS